MLFRSPYRSFRHFAKDMAKKFPRSIEHMAVRAEEFARGLVTGGTLFEELGFFYVGPIDGHNLDHLLPVLKNIRDSKEPGPVLVHVVTQKGKGYEPAEKSEDKYHGVTKFDVVTGTQVKPKPSAPAYQKVFAEALIKEAELDDKIVAINAAMPSGTSLDLFAKRFPNRCFDVGIAEQHAVTFAAGLAAEGMKPVVAIYSTFLQRAWDQIVHDVCQNDQPVLIGVDRAGLVGEDGTSHQGMFMLSAQRQIPRLVIASPRDEQQLRALVRTALAQDHPFALHYPRDSVVGVPVANPTPLPIGVAEVLHEGSQIAILAFGPIIQRVAPVAERLRAEGISVALVNAIWASPLDHALVRRYGESAELIVTVEESVEAGGFGGAVVESLAAHEAETGRRTTATVVTIGIPAGRFVDHGSVADLRALIGLDEAGIERRIRDAWSARSR